MKFFSNILPELHIWRCHNSVIHLTDKLLFCGSFFFGMRPYFTLPSPTPSAGTRYL